MNNLGGSTALELCVVVRGVVASLRAAGVRSLLLSAGPVMTALDMHGVSVSVLPLMEPTW